MRRLSVFSLILVPILGLAAPLGLSGCGSKEKRIIILTNGNSPFWDAARVGLQEAEKDLKLKDAGLKDAGAN